MGYRKRDIFALERKVKDAYATDKSSGDMYTSIKDLASAILVTKRMAFDSTEVEEISHMLATDLYLRLNHENFVVTRWTKYIRLRLYRMRSDWLSETRGVELEIKDVVEADRFKQVLFGSSAQLGSRQNIIELEDAVSSLSGAFLECFDMYVRYREDTWEYTRVKMSVMLTIEDRIKHNRDKIVLFKLGSEYESYIRFMVNLIYKRLSVYYRKLFGEELNRSSELKELVSACWNLDPCD